MAKKPNDCGLVTLHGGIAGHLLLDRGEMVAGLRGLIRIPIPFFLLEHQTGLALVDCGLSPLLLDPRLPYRKELRAAGIEVEMDGDGTAAARLSRYGVKPATIDTVILTHCHHDHVGGLSQFSMAEVLVQRAEWTFAQEETSKNNFLYKREFFVKQNPLLLLDGGHDLFGDGSVTFVPTPGHTPGHQSVLVRSRNGSFLIAADACYFCNTLETRRLPPQSDADRMNSSLDVIQSLAAEGVEVIAGHEPNQWPDTNLHVISRNSSIRKDLSC